MSRLHIILTASLITSTMLPSLPAFADPREATFELIEQQDEQGNKIACGFDFIVNGEYDGFQGRLVLSRFYKLTLEAGAGEMDEFGEYIPIQLTKGSIIPVGADKTGDKPAFDFSFADDSTNLIFEQPRIKEWRLEGMKNMLLKGFYLTYHKKYDGPGKEKDRVVYDGFIEAPSQILKTFDACQSAMFGKVVEEYKAKHGDTFCLTHPEKCSAIPATPAPTPPVPANPGVNNEAYSPAQRSLFKE